MNKLKFGDSEFDIPAIAQGKVVPYAAQIPFEESAAGKQIAELQKLRQEFEDYKSKQESARIADEKRRKTERKRSIFVSTLSGAIAGVISGVVLYYWPDILEWFSALVQ